MPTGSRVRRSIDAERLRDLFAPNETWNTCARVDDDATAIRWDPLQGWIVDVTPYGGNLEGDDETPCRVAAPLAGAGSLDSVPIERACEVVVEVIDGDSESNPVIVGRVHNSEDCQVPLEITGVPITGEVPASVPNPLGAWFVGLSPFDSELKKSPYNRAEQYEGQRLVQALVQIIEADQEEDGVLLGSRTADQSYVLGDDYTEALGAYVDALDTYATTMAPALDAITPGAGAAAATALKAAGVALKASLDEALSLKIKGE